MDWVASLNSAHLERIKESRAKGYKASAKELEWGAANLPQMANCPQCGRELGSDDPAGLCPKCLILGVFDSSVGANEAETQTIDIVAAAADGFGRYHILRTLGEGGMGTVYLAEQRDPIRRTVALKVVKLGMDTNEVLARFNHERQALAMMDHPNVARIFDAGATARAGLTS
jgi:eukaryotic-like serine/threonine-protein kinase